MSGDASDELRHVESDPVTIEFFSVNGFAAVGEHFPLTGIPLWTGCKSGKKDRSAEGGRNREPVS